MQYIYTCSVYNAPSHTVHVNEICRKKEEASKVIQTTRQIKQNDTPKAVTFPKKNELPRVGLKPTPASYIQVSSSAQAASTECVVRMCVQDVAKC